MEYQFPHVIENCVGEKIIFRELLKEPGGDRLLVGNYVAPGHGPVMHTHFLQEEVLIVIEGTIGYLIKGQPAQFASKGETIVFKPGVPHRFWNAGDDVLHCEGWIKPANTIVFFLSSIFAAQNKSGSGRPEAFDAAYLITRYASEYEMTELPWFVKKIIIPITYKSGMLLGRYKHFKNAPEPTRNPQP